MKFMWMQVHPRDLGVADLVNLLVGSLVQGTTHHVRIHLIDTSDRVA